MVVCDTPFVHEAMMLGAVSSFPDEIGYEDSPDVPVRCHYNRPEDAKKCAATFQGIADAWAAQIDRIGFPPPEPDEDGRLDVYYDSDTRGGAYTACSSHGDAIDDDGWTGCPAYIVMGWGIPDHSVAEYITHEFNHALQYAIDSREWSLPIWEGVATAATYWTYADVPPSSQEVGDYQTAPWLGLVGDGYFLQREYGLTSWYEYGSAEWVIHLDTTYGTGDGTVGGLALWTNAAQPGGPDGNTVTVLDSYQAITGDWIAALMDFDVQRTRVGTAHTPSWALWAGPQAKLILDPAIDAVSLPTTVAPTIPPYATGVDYVRVTGVPAGATLHIEAQTKDTESSWGILAVQGGASDWATGPTFDWRSTTNDVDITVGVVNLEQDGFATTGDDEDLKAGQSTLAIALSVVEPTGGDDTASDDTAAASDDSATASDDTAAPENDDGSGGESGPGCGCGSSPGRQGWVLPLWIAFIAFRRSSGKDLDRH
jgi:hypothetical protein